MNLRSLRKLDLGACLTQRPTYYAGCLHVGGGGWADDILPREGLLRRFVTGVAGQPGVDLGDGRAILDVGSWVSHLPPTVGYAEHSRVELLEVLE